MSFRTIFKIALVGVIALIVFTAIPAIYFFLTYYHSLEDEVVALAMDIEPGAGKLLVSNRGPKLIGEDCPDPTLLAADLDASGSAGAGPRDDLA